MKATLMYWGTTGTTMATNWHRAPIQVQIHEGWLSGDWPFVIEGLVSRICPCSCNYVKTLRGMQKHSAPARPRLGNPALDRDVKRDGT